MTQNQEVREMPLPPAALEALQREVGNEVLKALAAANDNHAGTTAVIVGTQVAVVICFHPNDAVSLGLVAQETVKRQLEERYGAPSTDGMTKKEIDFAPAPANRN